ncbi:tetratricopeptide repeat protein [candidate division TA06 bacterium]|nr:tetratricopeptide repeat protein [candidate division TA06 bacterium]
MRYSLEQLTKSWRPYGVLMALILLVYFPAVNFGYSHYDDTDLVISNYGILSDLGNIGKIFLKDAFGGRHQSWYYRPVLTLSLMVDAAIGGIAPMIYHVTNIIIHILTSWLLWLFMLRLGVPKTRSLLLSLLFSAHPVLSQAVAWIPGRNDSLMALFSMSTMITLINYGENHKLRWLLGHLAFTGLAFFTKESALILPLIFSVYLLWVIDNKAPVKIWVYLISSWVILYAGYFTLKLPNLGLNDIHVSRFSDILFGLVTYWGKIFFPVNLAIVPVRPDMSIIWGLAGSAIAAFLLISQSIGSKKLFSLGLLIFISFLLPPLLFSPNLPGFMEQRLYLPFIGFTLMLASLKTVIRIPVKYQYAIFFISLAAFSLKTSRYINVFANAQSCWESAVKSSPSSPFSHNNIGVIYQKEGKLDQAKEHYLQATKLNTNWAAPYSNLGLIFEMEKETDQAVKYYLKAINLEPNNFKILLQLGDLLKRKGDRDKARQYYNRVISLSPDYAEAHSKLARVYQSNGENIKAREEYIRALNLNPNMADTRKLLAKVYFDLGDTVKGIEEYNKAVEIGKKRF